MDTQQSPDSSDTAAATTSDAEPKRRPFSIRAFTSLLLALSMLVMAFAGVMLYLSPRGRVANWTDWTLIGLGKEQWAGLHMNASLLFVVAAVLHLVLNWSIFFRYLKKKTAAGLQMKRELALAALIAIACVAGTISELPPFNAVAALNEDIKDYWEQRATRAPVAHAEELTLEEFAAQVDLPVGDLAEALRKEGFDAADVQLTVGDLGRQKGVAPSAVLAALRKYYPQAGAMTGKAPGPGRGMQSEGGLPEDVQASEEHGPGFGPGGGQGPGHGQGRGMGMGRGMGRGRGMGLGPGQDGERGRRGADE
jgi:hypothetical protein